MLIFNVIMLALRYTLIHGEIIVDNTTSINDSDLVYPKNKDSTVTII